MDMSAREFRELFDAVSNWGRWGEDDDRGALNHLTPERVAAAAGLVRSGVTVTLSQPLRTDARIDMPEPADHHMTMLTDVDIGSGSVRFAKDYIGVDYHNDGHSHIDAFSHVAFDGRLFGGEADGSVTADGAQAGAIEVLKDGLIGRGVLLDIPRARGVPWLEPGEHVFTEDLEAAERGQAVTVGTGDILLVRTGHTRRQAEVEPWDTTKAKAGLHPTTAVVPGGPPRRGARLGRQQRHGSEHHRGGRVPHPRSGDQRDGDPSARLPPVRGCRAPVRGRGSLGVPVRGRAAADRRRHRVADQPHRDLLRAGDHRPERRIPDKDAGVVGESRWPMAAAVVVAIVLTLLVPSEQRLLPAGLVPGIEFILLIALIAGDPGAIDRRSRSMRVGSILLVSLLGLSALAATVKLIDALITGGAVTNSASELLQAGTIIWVGNNLAFGLLYWELDGGGAAARAHHARSDVDFAFPQQMNPELAPADWSPQFVDYLYLAFTNATAFSPTDAMPIARWAKVAMLVQALISLAILGLVIARAVNVLA